MGFIRYIKIDLDSEAREDTKKMNKHITLFISVAYVLKASLNFNIAKVAY